MNAKFLDLSVKAEDRAEFLATLERMLDHGQFVMGDELTDFEADICAYTGRKNVVGVSSGSDAVYLALRALKLKPGDEVITPCLSWIATANGIIRAGGIPVFADIRQDLNIDPRSIEKCLSKDTKAILTVDFTGKLCDYDAIEDIASRNHVPIVQDGSQAFGARRGERLTGKVGLLSAISHNPMKVFGALGEAGSVLTDDDDLAERVRILRYNGTINKEYCIEPSLNGRMDSLQAAFLRIKLRKLADVLKKRFDNFSQYSRLLAENPYLVIPEITHGEVHSLYTLTLRAERRDELMRHLTEKILKRRFNIPYSCVIRSLTQDSEGTPK